MKTDDFEEQLQRQPFRKVPEAWRETILARAEAAQPVSRSEALPARSWWRELFWPCPQAWAGLAAAWIIMLVLNAQVSRTEQPALVKAKATPISQQTLIALQQQRQLQMELSGTEESPAMAEPARPRPRTQRAAEEIRA